MGGDPDQGGCAACFNWRRGVPLPAPTRLPIAWGLIGGEWLELGEAPSRSAALALASDNGADRFAWLPEGEVPPARKRGGNA